MKFRDYIKNFVVFDDKDNFVNSFDTYEEVLNESYPDNYAVYCRGHFVKHIKEFKQISSAKLEKLNKALELFSNVFYLLFC